MHLLMVGVNHQSTSVQVREQVALIGAKLDLFVDQWSKRFAHAEVVVLSTCNRTELYVARPIHEPPSPKDLHLLLAELSGIEAPTLKAVLIHHEQEQAAIHLFRVTAGLESMVLGEPQIVNQVKRAYDDANTRGSVGPMLHKVFQHSLAAAKQVRTQTRISDGRTSVGSIAVDFARRIFDRFDDKTIVGIGAGEMAKVTLRHLQLLQPAQLWLTNRTTDKAQRLAQELNLDAATGRSFNDLDALLVEADIVLTSTGATQPIITANRFRPLAKHRRSRPLLIIDIAVPRDIDPDIGKFNDVYLYNIDDLQQVANHTQDQRSQQIDQCQNMILECVQHCMFEIQHRDVGQLIRQLRHRLHEIIHAEQHRTEKKLATALRKDVHQVLDEHTHRLVNKILHLPLSQLGHKLDQPKTNIPLSFCATALRHLFALDESLLADNSTPQLMNQRGTEPQPQPDETEQPEPPPLKTFAADQNPSTETHIPVEKQTQRPSI